MSRKKALPYQTEGDIFATRLRLVMNDRGLNQTKLANLIESELGETLQRQTISQYMSGQSKPDTHRLSLLCKALDVSADYLIGLSSYQADESRQITLEDLQFSEAAAENLSMISFSRFAKDLGLVDEQRLYEKGIYLTPGCFDVLNALLEDRRFIEVLHSLSVYAALKSQMQDDEPLEIIEGGLRMTGLLIKSAAWVSVDQMLKMIIDEMNTK